MSPDRERQSSQRFRAQTTTPEDAALYSSRVVPRYSQLFGRLLLPRIPTNERLQVLDVGCGTGYPTLEILPRLGEGSRIIALDPDSALLDVARRRALDESGRRIFFTCAMAEELAFGDEVFDLVVSNLAFGSFLQAERALAEMNRVLARGGRLLLTHALEGTFEEIFDIFREIALRFDDAALSSRIERIQGRHPTPETFRAVFENAGFEQVEVASEGLPAHLRPRDRDPPRPDGALRGAPGVALDRGARGRREDPRRADSLPRHVLRRRTAHAAGVRGPRQRARLKLMLGAMRWLVMVALALLLAGCDESPEGEDAGGGADAAATDGGGTDGGSTDGGGTDGGGTDAGPAPHRLHAAASARRRHDST